MGGNTNNTKPTVNIPTVNIPTVNIPTVNTPTVNIPTVNTPTVNIPTVKTQKNNMREAHKPDKKDTPLARHSRKRGGGYQTHKETIVNTC